VACTLLVAFGGVGLIVLIIVLFPDGHLPTQRWAVWAYAGLVACVAVVGAANAFAPVADHDIRVDASGNLTTRVICRGWLANPPAWFDVVVVVGLAGIVLLAVGRQVLSWRRAAGERRQQLKWLAFGAAVTVVWLIATFFLNLPVVGIAALPVSMGIAILKYRLYDIDRIISRTLAYAIVTGLVIGLYAGLVLLATQVFKFHSTVAVAAATLAAALFNPLRLRVQRSVDRRFNRGPLRLRPDRGRVRGPPERCRGPGLGPRRPSRRRAHRPGTRPCVGVDPGGQPALTRVTPQAGLCLAMDLAMAADQLPRQTPVHRTQTVVACGIWPRSAAPFKVWCRPWPCQQHGPRLLP